MEFEEYLLDQKDLLEAGDITVDQFLSNIREFIEENYIG